MYFFFPLIHYALVPYNAWDAKHLNYSAKFPHIASNLEPKFL